MPRLRTAALPALAAALAAAGATPADASTLMQRPNRVTANPVTTTNKVLVAVPTDRLSSYDYLYAVTPGDLDAHGIPVAVDGATPFNSTVVLMNAPLLDARDGFWGVNHLRAEKRPGFSTFALGSSAPEGNQGLGEEADALRAALGDSPRVYAADGLRLADLPERLQSDPWALLNAGRHRDAGSVFAAADAGPARDAGIALAAALLGRVDEAGEALAALDADAPLVNLPIGPKLAGQARGLAAELYGGTPAADALTRIADAAVAGDAPTLDLSK